MHTLQRIVKRKGHSEYFDARKVYGSVYAACMTLRMHDTEAELIADMVSHEIEEQVKTKEGLTTPTLHKMVSESLLKYHPDAAYMYEHHRDII
jgi:transcriptional regulator NrdR family protein